MSTQLALTYDDRFEQQRRVDAVIAELRKLVDGAVPFKDVVCDTDTRASTLSQALKGGDSGHRVSIDVLLYCVAKSPNLDLLRAIAAIRDLDVKPREMTAEQKLAELARWFADNPALRKTLETDTGVRL